MADERDLIDPKLQAQMSLLEKSIQDTFNEQRGTISAAAQQTGGRRSSTYFNAIGRQFGQEQSAISQIIADTLAKQIGIEESEKNRTFTAEQNALDRQLRKEMYEKDLAYKEDIAAKNEAAAQQQSDIDKAALIGDIAVPGLGTGLKFVSGLFEK